MKYLIKMILLFFLWGIPVLIINAQTVDLTSQDSSATQPGISTDQNTSSSDNNVILNGQIGPYDPSEADTNDPFYNFSGDIEGTIPDNYFTIAVTVPTHLEFSVLEHPINVKGQFYSPKYTVTNNATRPVHISVATVENVVPSTEQEYIPLYLEKPVEGDGKVQIDLNLSLTNLSTSVFHNVNLTTLKVGKLPDSTLTVSKSADNTLNNYLGVLGLKEQGVLQLNSTSWDRPLAEGLDKDAKVNFDVQLIFSLNDPTQP